MVPKNPNFNYCGQIDDEETEPKAKKDPSEVLFKKKQTDSREYTENMRHFGADEVLRSSEIVDMACSQAIEQAKEEAKRAKSGEVIDANIFNEDE
jgi:hypothetical protein